MFSDGWVDKYVRVNASFYWAKPAAGRWKRPAVRSTLSGGGGAGRREKCNKFRFAPCFQDVHLPFTSATGSVGEKCWSMMCKMLPHHCKDKFVGAIVYENQKKQPKKNPRENLINIPHPRMSRYMNALQHYPGEFFLEMKTNTEVIAHRWRINWSLVHIKPGVQLPTQLKGTEERSLILDRTSGWKNK